VVLSIARVGNVDNRATAADWPQLGGTPQRNMVSVERGLPARFHPGHRIRRNKLITFDVSTAKNVKWISQLGSKTYSSPAIADGRVFIGTNDEVLEDERFERTQGGVVRCLSEQDGTLIWQIVIPRTEAARATARHDELAKVSKDFDALNLGVCSTPTVDGDRVYVVSNRCEVLCLDVAGQANGNDGPFVNEAIFSSSKEMMPLTPQDGDILWRFDMLHDIPNFPHDAANCSILVFGDYLYVGTSNGVSYQQVVSAEAPALIVLNKHTGQLVARDETFISPNTFHGQWSSPSLGRAGGRDLILYGGGDGFCYAFAPIKRQPSGPTYLKEVWSFDANPLRYRQLCPTPSDYWDLAIKGRKGRLPAGEDVISPSEIIGTPVIHKGFVYVTIGQDPMHGDGRGALSCFDASLDGDITNTGRIWQYTDIGRSMATVSIADGLVYAVETSGKVHCLDATTGKLQWVIPIANDVWGSTLVADGKIYLGTRRGVSVLQAGREGKHLFDVKLSTRAPATPVAANGVLYVTTRRNLFAIQEKGEMAAMNASEALTTGE